MGAYSPTPPSPWRHHLLCSALLLIFIWRTAEANEELAALPPRGWNSYDSFSWIVDENAYMQNAQIMAQKLLPHGYQYAVIDFLWYRKYVDGVYTNSYGYDNIDEWGRPFPDLQRFPSSKVDRGFSQIASKGKPYMEDGKQWTARDIGLTHRTCAWMQCGFMSVNTDIGAGKAFLRSLYRQYADWGVDFVKVDCIFGTDYSPKEIITISELLQELDRPIILSVSPGTEVTPALAENISEHVNMYRITGDDWDKWKDVSSHFDVSSSFAAAKKIGAIGLQGRSWPDLDMLPFGWLTDPGVNQGPHRKCNLTTDEQKTQMALWSMVKSPLMYGGDLRHLDESTLSIITNPTLLKINHYSQNNMEMWELNDKGNLVSSYSRLCATVESVQEQGTAGTRAWVATGSKG
ncbi:hypothetical protein PR202_ga31443 [Eleusine coracana subsp. coracana]|uniref:Alpha-galactosidase n=1 Tax=Eleusine coracana subsp. coracana TaxID=191504 RepID=A0AAV5DQ84_ELECO|nr:hypothetical protein PR202_ga31443 [Eleusine coracana subsp. coracana]